MTLSGFEIRRIAFADRVDVHAVSARLHILRRDIQHKAAVAGRDDNLPHVLAVFIFQKITGTFQGMSWCVQNGYRNSPN